MKRILKSTLAILLVLGMLMGLTACHKVNEKALIVGGQEYTSAFYSCALVFADLEGQQYVYEKLGETAYLNYLEQTIDGVPYATWVKNRAIETIKDYSAYKIKCDELLLQCDEYASDATAVADSDWANYYSAIMSENGVGRGTFRWYSTMNIYKLGYFDYLYGKGGSKEIPAADITAELSDKYTLSNILSVDNSSLTETEFNDKVAKLESYVDRIKNGEKFEKIYAEFLGQTYVETDKEDTNTFSFNLASIIGSDKTQYTSEYYEDIKALANGEIKVIKKTTEGDTPVTTALLIYKNDVLDEKNPNFDDLKKIAMHSLKDEEFENDMKSFITSLQVEENERATKRFKVEKIKYPTGY